MFMASSCTYDVLKYWSTSLFDQNCGVQSADTHTRHMERQKVKTEGPKILSKHFFYFKTVIFGVPIMYSILTNITVSILDEVVSTDTSETFASLCVTGVVTVHRTGLLAVCSIESWVTFWKSGINCRTVRYFVSNLSFNSFKKNMHC